MDGASFEDGISIEVAQNLEFIYARIMIVSEGKSAHLCAVTSFATGGIPLRPNLGLTLLILLIIIILIPLYYLRKKAGPLTPNATFPVRLLARESGKIYRLDLEQYLIGVVAAEMLAEFAPEALKAQAIAARTIAVRRLKRFGGQGCQHCLQTDFCDDPAENQAWLSISALRQKWGTGFLKYYQKISRAVHDTSGVIMTYNNQPIDAVFHSTCGVGTAAALEVWGRDVPYLQSASCGFDYQSSHYRSHVQYNWPELARLLNLPTNSVSKIKITSLSPTGRVLELSFGQLRMSGDALRRKLTLTSTCFSWKTTKTGLIFSVIGYGHGVGMCQYGAAGMASAGYSYREILRQYYRGIQFKKIKY